MPGAVVFTPPDHEVRLDDVTQWWSYIPKASWQHPVIANGKLYLRDQDKLHCFDVKTK